MAKLNSSRRKGRRGSIQPQTASRCYKDLLKGSILESVGVEEQAQVINVSLCLCRVFYALSLIFPDIGQVEECRQLGL